MGLRSARTWGLLLVVTASACGGGGTSSDARNRDEADLAGPPVRETTFDAPTGVAEDSFPECGELPPRVIGTVAGDLDGDATDDAVVAVRCETVTAGAPNVVVAFLVDGASGQVADREVLVSQCSGSSPCEPGVSDEHLVGDLELGIVDGVVEVAGKAYSDDAPLCCPDLDLSLRFTWTGDGFDQVPRGE